jgi:hypothetical protein
MVGSIGLASAGPSVPETLSFRTRSVRGRWETCDMSLKDLTNPRHVARDLERRAHVKRPRTGWRRPGPDTEEVSLDAASP